MDEHKPSRFRASIVERITTSPGTISVLHAPAGHGKTALLNEIRRTLDSRGAPITAEIGEVVNAASAPWVRLDEEEAARLDAAMTRRMLCDASRSQTGIVIAIRLLCAIG